MTRKILILLTTIILLCSAGAAFAQFQEDHPSKFGLSLTSFMPVGSILRDKQSIWYGPTIDWHLKLDEDGRPTNYLSVTFLSTMDDSGYKPSEDSLTYTKIHRKPISDTRCHYFGYGAGIYKLKVDNTNIDGYQVGIHGLYGQEFRDAYFAEVRFNYLPNKDNINWSGIYLSVGTRLSM